MLNFFIIFGIIAIVIVFAIALKDKLEVVDKKVKFHYKKKNFFMTRAEHEFYDLLISILGNEYYIFAQVHLPTLVDNKVVGQNWRGAFKHISEKSVDFVLCDKQYISPKLAIELDDSSHERQDRKERDSEVERILGDAGLPLLRLTNHGQFNSDELLQRIRQAVDVKENHQSN